MKVTFDFVSTADRLPENSGRYLTINANGTLITTLPFSSKHQAFNAHDDDEDAEYVISISYWAEIPDELDNVLHQIRMEDDDE